MQKANRLFEVRKCDMQQPIAITSLNGAAARIDTPQPLPSMPHQVISNCSATVITCKISLRLPGLVLFFDTPIFATPGALGLLSNATTILAKTAREVLDILKSLWQHLPMQSVHGLCAIFCLAWAVLMQQTHEATQ